MLREICVPALIKEFLFKVIPLIFQCICETMHTVVRHRNAISSDDSNGSTPYTELVLCFLNQHDPTSTQHNTAEYSKCSDGEESVYLHRMCLVFEDDAICPQGESICL